MALFHHHTFNVAMTGLAAIVAYKLAFTGFKTGPGIAGLLGHLQHEWVTLANLFCLLMGFALLSRHFEKSEVPAIMPRFLPDDWKGGFLLLVLISILSSFLDNIAAALIGGVVAKQVFNDKLHIGYLAAIVAASNAGGSGSVVGDTTTTMMWIDGVSPLSVVRCLRRGRRRPGRLRHSGGVPAARLLADHEGRSRPARISIGRVLFIVFFILLVAIGANVWANQKAKYLLDLLPVIGIAVWAAILLTAPLRAPDWSSAA